MVYNTLAGDVEKKSQSAVYEDKKNEVTGY